ncbi:hypothetical protein GDO81_004977 [Engystomops pustulosus]|uniref:Uncharacterized protein n=1 Tax=Engystomops pustulosus TaxID=76066 RepID=A0AAV7CMK1_ENGPU|nr:hypothetical protein GDO81_004977 [Engystomops pustulosus]
MILSLYEPQTMKTSPKYHSCGRHYNYVRIKSNCRIQYSWKELESNMLDGFVPHNYYMNTHVFLTSSKASCKTTKEPKDVLYRL